MSIGPAPISSRLPIEGGTAVWTSPWGNWLNRAFEILFAAEQSGVSGARPTRGLWVGRPYFDTTLGYPIWWNGTAWVDATGSPA